MSKLVRTSDDATSTFFVHHGRMESRLDGKILVNIATGPFNAEFINAIAISQRDLLDVVDQLDQWAQLYLFKVSAMCSPDTIEALKNYLTGVRGTMKRPIATAFVMDDSVEGGGIMGPNYEQIYRQANLNFQLFESELQARAWLEQLLSRPTTGLPGAG